MPFRQKQLLNIIKKEKKREGIIMPQFTTPIFSASEKSLANFVINLHALRHYPITGLKHLNNELAILEGFAQSMYNRTLMRYNRNFIRVNMHYYLPDLSEKLTDNRCYLTKPFTITKIDKKTQQKTIINYPDLSISLMNIQDPIDVLNDLTKLVNELMQFSPDFLNTLVIHDSRHCYGVLENFEELRPIDFKHLYQQYLNNTK